jgi:hypothetical protein
VAARETSARHCAIAIRNVRFKSTPAVSFAQIPVVRRRLVPPVVRGSVTSASRPRSVFSLFDPGGLGRIAQPTLTAVGPRQVVAGDPHHTPRRPTFLAATTTSPSAARSSKRVRSRFWSGGCNLLIFGMALLSHSRLGVKKQWFGRCGPVAASNLRGEERWPTSSES